MATRFPLACLSVLVLTSTLFAQNTPILGRVSDAAGGVIAGAKLELVPSGKTARTDDQGTFSLNDVVPGNYILTASYVGFAIFTRQIEVRLGAPVRVDAVLQVGTQNESITVHADRQGSEVEALDIERTADNIVQVLPADVINSLPNTNIADAVGRLPSVSLERDEGEGKYIQIRGTEPRLSNVTVDGIHLPSPEGVRNVKLDAIPSDLVESVELNKTLSANQDADAIGGSANLVTRTPTNQPYVSLLAMGGYTPITGGRTANQFAGTFGQRFGSNRKFGALFGFSYDHNNRGIDDVEPANSALQLPNGSTFLAAPDTADLRNYHYDRSRYGFDGQLDYKLAEMSSLYIRGLFSHFNDYGEDWIYTPAIDNFVDTATLSNPAVNTCGLTSASQHGNPTGCGHENLSDSFRRPAQQLVSVQAGARHLLPGGAVLNYEAALSEASYTGGFSFLRFFGPSNVAFAIDTTNPFIPKFPVQNGVNVYDPSLYSLGFGDTETDGIFERDAVGDISLSKPYYLSGHFSTFEIGLKGWDASKTSLINRQDFTDPGGEPMSQFTTNFHDGNYYFGQYQYGPVFSYQKVVAAIAPPTCSTCLTPNWANNLPNDWDESERIWAGYAMDTIDFGKFRLQGGLRLESTGDNLRANNTTFDSSGNLTSVSPLLANHSYVDVFPSVQLQYRFASDTVLRLAYGAGIARPNFQDIAPYNYFDQSASQPQTSKGNPNLKPTYAQNFDILAEHYFGRAGLIQGGFFYKYLTDPIYNVTVNGGTVATLINGPNAHITGFEMAWQQQLRFMPGALNGMGIRANYGYTTSRAVFPAGGRMDNPTLVRTAPNNWNFDVTYDRKGVSARMGLTHNDAYIWSYGGSNAKDYTGDTYLYPHTQVDAQVSYWIPGGRGLQAIVSGLNLNNEMFGFYNGAERYPIQREYYGRTISAGLRWTLRHE